MHVRHLTVAATAGLAAVLAAAVLPTTQAVAGWAAPTATVEFAWNDHVDDLTLRGASGPSFTPRITPEAADLHRTEVTSSESMLYTRVDLREWYGDGLASDGQHGSQIIGVEYFSNNRVVAGARLDFRYGDLARPTLVWQGPHPSYTNCPDYPEATWSSAGDWVLFRVPISCVDAEVTDAVVRSDHWLTRHAGGRVVSVRQWSDVTVSSVPAP